MKEPKQKYTNKQLLLKGIKRMALAVPLLIASPYLLTLSFLNKENFMFYVALPMGLIAGFFAIYLCFKGLKTIMDSMFQ